MAIFSQDEIQTKIDQRRYNMTDPNRMVPYTLPKHIESKLLQLMKNLELETGSVDLIKTVDGKYYFLEVNPVGHYEIISYICNYNINREIAKYLTT
jgi:glutathione synthase/RimK-type ligase-like ATP-grasp enzyme